MKKQSLSRLMYLFSIFCLPFSVGLISALADTDVTSAPFDAELCTYQRYSKTSGSVVGTYRDSNCYAAQRYCNEAVHGDTSGGDVTGWSTACKTTDERIQGASATQKLYFKGVLQGTYFCTRYHVSYPQSDADSCARNRCERERDRRRDASPNPNDWIWHSTCESS